MKKKMEFKFLICLLVFSFFGLFLFKNAFAAVFSFKIKSLSLSQVSSKNQEVEVLLEISGLANESFFRVAWQEKDGDPYFGYMKNDKNEWVKTESLSNDCSVYYKVSQTGDSQLNLLTKIGNDKELVSGSYLIKAHRFTNTCKSNEPAENSVKIDVNLPSLTPTATLTPTPVPPTNTPQPTTTPTLTPAPTATPVSYSNIFINEFMASPESGDEWVELYNDNDFEVALSNWYIGDRADSGNSPKSISGAIATKSYKQFFIGSGFLNNDGDEVRLLDASQSEKDKKTYSSSTHGKSWSKDSSGNWCETDPTPNSANPSCPSSGTSPTNTLTPTPTSSPTTILTPTPAVIGSPTPAGEVLAEEVTSESGFFQLAGEKSSDEKDKIASSSGKAKTKRAIIFPILAVIVGLGFIGFSVFFFLKHKKFSS